MSKKFLGVVRLFILSMLLSLPTILHAEVFFQEDFESGNLSGWSWITDTTDGCYSADQIVSTTEDKFTGTYSAKFINHIGDMCTYMQSRMGLSRGIGQGENLYFRFRLRFSSNHEWTSENKTASIIGNSVFAPQPRVHYNLTRKDDGGPIPVPTSLYQAMPQLLVRTNKEAYNNGWRPANSPDGDIFVQNIDTANPVYISTGQWYTIEIYIRPDATGNGIVKMWINGKLIMEHNNLYTLTSGRTADTYSNLIVGGTFNQDPEGNYIQTESSHYFDDVIVSDTCNSCDANSSYSGGSGSDGDSGSEGSSSAGDGVSNSGNVTISGGGCGFVQGDDGKGPRANKGEGLPSMIILIITLAGIAIVRRFSLLKNSTPYKTF